MYAASQARFQRNPGSSVPSGSMLSYLQIHIQGSEVTVASSPQVCKQSQTYRPSCNDENSTESLTSLTSACVQEADGHEPQEQLGEQARQLRCSSPIHANWLFVFGLSEHGSATAENFRGGLPDARHRGYIGPGVYMHLRHCLLVGIYTVYINNYVCIYTYTHTHIHVSLSLSLNIIYICTISIDVCRSTLLAAWNRVAR